MWCRSRDVKKKNNKEEEKKKPTQSRHCRPFWVFKDNLVKRSGHALLLCGGIHSAQFSCFATRTLMTLLSSVPVAGPEPPGGEPLPRPPCLLAGFSSPSLLFIHKPLFSSLNCSIFEGSHICQLSVGGWHRRAWRHLQRLPL